MALNNGGLRSFASKLLTSTQSFLPKPVNKGFHSTGVKRMGGGHGHGHDEPAYIHAKHIYDLSKMKNQKVTIFVRVWSAFAIGVYVPIWVTIYTQRKTSSA